MTEEIEKLVKEQVIELAQPGESGVRNNPPGSALSTIAIELGKSYRAIGSIVEYVQKNSSDQNAQRVEHWLGNAEPAIEGLRLTIDSLLGVENRKLVPGGVVAHAWMLDAAVAVTGDHGLYDDPEKVRMLGRAWKDLEPDFKDRVQAHMKESAPPITSIPDYAALDPARQEAYTRFDEFVKCGGRGQEGHGHNIVVPDLWVPSDGFIESTTPAAQFRNYAVSSEMAGGMTIGGYASDTCAWSGLQDKTPPAGLSMIADKAVALNQMIRKIPLRRGVSNDLVAPLRSMATAYHNIAAAASPALYALQPVTSAAAVRGL